MKKSILNLGKTLNKAEQKAINGGGMGMSCEELGWNETTCANGWDPEGQPDSNYFKCC
ncbi:hypothetical protein [uncultured Lacinutrix sp.]|uniref:hypothetical protein n=1 Tax=uncultured Lacinutrix sp. TaxID=574032 RepID=UPI00260E1D0E|nr:hypothetical protein [uncultured Lacinutrix sp.]